MYICKYINLKIIHKGIYKRIIKGNNKMNLKELSTLHQQNPNAFYEENLLGENKILYSVKDVDGLIFLKNTVKLKLDKTNKNFETVLTKFVKEDNLSCVEWLLKEGGLSHVLNYGNHEEKTPIFYAKSLEVAKILVEYGADVNHSDEEGRTVLHKTFSYQDEKLNDFDLVEYFVQQGVDVNEEDLQGNTPLFFQKEVKLADKFIEMGAKLDHLNKFGTSPKTDFFKSYKKEMVQWFNRKNEEIYEQKMMEATNGHYYKHVEEEKK